MASPTAPRSRTNSLEGLGQLELSRILDVTSRIFSSIDDMDETVRIICEATNALLSVDKNTLWLFDPFENDRTSLFAKIFDKELCPALSKSQLASVASHRKIPVDKGIAGWVATEEKVAIVTNAYDDPRFNPVVDQQTGYHTHTILTVPIRCNTPWNEIISCNVSVQRTRKYDVKTTPSSNVIGVLQLVNKLPVPMPFTAQDQTLALLLADYIGIALNNCISYRKMVQAQLQANIAMDMLVYHHQVDDSTLEKCLKRAESPEFLAALPEDYLNFSFSPRLLPEEDLVPFVIHMFLCRRIDVNLQVSKKVIARLIITAKRSYRDVPYHNFWHAASVCHAAFVFIEQCNLIDLLGVLATDMLLLATLTHDVDHRGTNNGFQTICSSDLACLYSSEGSILERHHLSQTLGIVSTSGCQILAHLNEESYNDAVDYITHIILSTDLANHFKKCLPALESITPPTGAYDPEDYNHRKTLLSLITTACDLSQVTKPFELSKTISDHIYQEFHAQGDLEKQHGRSPIPMMDRTRADVPREQVGFLDSVALPVYRALAAILPSAQPGLDAALANRDRWAALAKEKSDREAT